MRLEDCRTDDVAVVLTSPFRFSEPEPDWLEQAANGVIPNTLLLMYKRANYLSFGTAPSFLRDDKNHLFSYFCLMLRSLKESLVEAEEEKLAFLHWDNLCYDVDKEFAGLAWDPKAPNFAKRHFRHFIIALSACFDAVAELIAIFFTGEIAGLKVGKGDFSRVYEWVLKPLFRKGIVSPQYVRLETMHAAMRPHIVGHLSETNWFPLMQMLRNKGAHLGSAHFREMAVKDATGTFQTFIPRVWPYYGRNT